MKTAGIIIYILLGIWAIFSFDTEKINLFSRYYIGNIIANPYKYVSYSIICILMTIMLTFIFYKEFYLKIQNQAKIIEPALSNFKDFNIEIDSLKTTAEYITIYNKFVEEKKSKTDKERILRFIDDTRFFYNNYPSSFKNNKLFNQQYNMNYATQITALKIGKYKHTILFVSHNDGLPDKKVTLIKFDEFPSNEKLHKILDPIFDDKILDSMKENFDYWLKNNIGIHGSAGISVTIGNTDKKNKWMWLGVPEPFKDNKGLNLLLTESIWLPNKLKN